VLQARAVRDLFSEKLDVVQLEGFKAELRILNVLGHRPTDVEAEIQHITKEKDNARS
jgi:hypothetical protein